MLYIILDELIIHYEGWAEQVEEVIQAMGGARAPGYVENFLDDVLSLKRYVFALTRLAEQHRAVYAALTRPDFPFVSGEQVEPYFRGLEARLARLLDLLGAAREAVNGAFDIYTSRAAHATNQAMRTLTMVSTVLLPMAAIFGFFGANFTEEGSRALRWRRLCPAMISVSSA